MNALIGLNPTKTIFGGLYAVSMTAVMSMGADSLHWAQLVFMLLGFSMIAVANKSAEAVCDYYDGSFSHNVVIYIPLIMGIAMFVIAFAIAPHWAQFFMLINTVVAYIYAKGEINL